MRTESNFKYVFVLLIISLACLIMTDNCSAVTTKVTRHATSADFLKGQTENVVVGSLGTVSLGQAAQTLAEKLGNDVWSINSIVVSGPTVFIGTSPNGGIYKYSLGELTQIYPIESEDGKGEELLKSPGEDESQEVKSKQHLANEHVYAMATDVSGRLLAAVSGAKCRLIRFEAGKTKDILEPKIVFEPNDVKYIFAITLDASGNIYLATGPKGEIYKLDSFAKNAKVIYESRQKNILSLTVGKDGLLYAGTDGHGIIYRVDPSKETASVLYDSGQDEVTSLLFLPDSKDLFAAATSAQIVSAPQQFKGQLLVAGRPETVAPEKGPKEGGNGLKLQVPNAKKTDEAKEAQKEITAPKPPKPTKASFVYKITPEGYVSEVFNETAVFFCLAQQEKKLLLGTGNNGQLFSIDPATEQQAVIYQDKQSPQITSIAVAGDDIYLGSANPAKLIKLAKTFASQGNYTSDLIDASQPAKWGKLHIEAEIPQTCKISVSSRSGNVNDANDPSFSEWTEPVQIKEPVQLTCPVARFCQYKLILHSDNGKETPVVRMVTVADIVPNLAPQVEAVNVARYETPDKAGIFKIASKAKDENNDKLIYKIDFRQIGRTSWIKIEDQIETETFDWNGKTVEDGRYEIRVTASDERSNTPETKLTGTRISEPVVVDNTPPAITSHAITKSGKNATVKMHVADKLSVIGKVEYAVDSNSKWLGVLPDDFVYDTLEENFTIVIEDLQPGQHVIAVKISDDVGNTAYKSFEVDI